MKPNAKHMRGHRHTKQESDQEAKRTKAAEAYLAQSREAFTRVIESARQLGPAGRGVLAGPLAKRPPQYRVAAR